MGPLSCLAQVEADWRLPIAYEAPRIYGILPEKGNVGINVVCFLGFFSANSSPKP